MFSKVVLTTYRIIHSQFNNVLYSEWRILESIFFFPYAATLHHTTPQLIYIMCNLQLSDQYRTVYIYMLSCTLQKVPNIQYEDWFQAKIIDYKMPTKLLSFLWIFHHNLDLRETIKLYRYKNRCVHADERKQNLFQHIQYDFTSKSFQI